MNEVITAGLDIGRTTVATALYSSTRGFVTPTIIEHPSRVLEGTTAAVAAVDFALTETCRMVGVDRRLVRAAGLDYPGPASVDGKLSKKGSTNYSGAEWREFNLRAAVADALGILVTYDNDGNRAGRYGHNLYFGEEWRAKSSYGAVVGSGLGGWVIDEGKMVHGGRGFGGEVGHVLLPTNLFLPEGMAIPVCGCGRRGDAESIACKIGLQENLLPFFLREFPSHPFAQLTVEEAGPQLKMLDPLEDQLAQAIFRLQAVALAYLFDIAANNSDPDVYMLGGGLFENSDAFNDWFLGIVRQTYRSRPGVREEQAEVPIVLVPDRDMAASRGGALDAFEALTA